MSYEMHPEITLGKVKLKVSDLNRSLVFYQEVVGFQILRKDGDSAELTVDGVNTLVELQEIANAVITPKRTFSGLYHFAILLPTRKDLGLILRRLNEASIHVGQSDHTVSEALYISDPDGNGIELYRDRPRAEWNYDEKGQIIMGGDSIDVDGLLNEAEGSTWHGLPGGTRIGHVHLHVTDLVKSKQFYCDLLGFNMMVDLADSFKALFISAGGYHHHLGLNIWSGKGAPIAPEHGTGIDFFTIILPNQKEIYQIHKILMETGIPVEEQGDGIFVKDPSGIKIHLISNLVGSLKDEF